MKEVKLPTFTLSGTGGGDSARGNFEVKTNSSSLPFYLGIKGARGKKITDKVINVNINRGVRKEIEILKQKTLYEENLYNDNNMLFYDNSNSIMQYNKNPSKRRK